MTDAELNNILTELYRLDPELMARESDLRELISRMSGLKPNNHFDAAFASRLKAQLLGYEPVAPKTLSLNLSNMLNNKFMNKKFYLTAGSLAAAAVVILVASTMFKPGLNFPGSQNAPETISQLPAGAFGNLASLNSSAIAGAGAGGDNAAPAANPVSTQPEAQALDSRTVLTESGAYAAGSAGIDSVSAKSFEGDIAMSDRMMIAPYYSYTYEYAGEELDLTETEGSVYRRLKGDGQSGRALANLVSGLSFPEVDLKSFSNLKATNLSLIEDKEEGLMVNFDFNEDNIYISENWEKWRIMERENCGGDQACWDRWRLEPSDVPSDSELISLADSFLSDHGISREHYGEPQVDNAWRELYAQTSYRGDFYVPEYSTVIYPLLVDGEPVRDQSGFYTGLRVTINLLKNAASGVSGLTPYRYQTSTYGLETSEEKIREVAENGGWNRGWYGGPEAATRNLELDTPERGYIQLWRYTDGKNDELLVPALIFPILNPPTDQYYGPRTIIVPLVREMLDELSGQPRILPMPVDVDGGDGSSASPQVLMTEPGLPVPDMTSGSDPLGSPALR